MDDRLYENLLLWNPSATSCEGLYATPKLLPLRELPRADRWRSIGQIRGRDLRETDGIQCYVYDYKLTGLWTRPTAYLPMLRKAGCVLTPDFSLYADVPMVLNLYNHYRKHWLGAYWQTQGITVVPTICWSDEKSFDWCFDGEPIGSVVSVSSVGTQRYAETKAAFMRGYDAMLERLKPEVILFFGNVPGGCRGNICPVEAFYKSIVHRRKKV